MDEEHRAMVTALLANLMYDSPDSIDIGTASKGGGIKVYGNYLRMEEFKKKVDNALVLRDYAKVRVEP